MLDTEPATAGFAASPIDRNERLRVRSAVEEARRLLGRDAVADEAEVGPTPELIRALATELSGEAGDADRRHRVAHERQLDRLRERFRLRREAFGRVEEGVRQLREITSPPTILQSAPRELCRCSDFGRALLSTVADGRMVAMTAFFEGDQTAAAAAVETLAGRPIDLEHPLLETEVLRRRRATGVADARLNPRVSPVLTEVMSWDAYVVAPVVIQGRVIAVIHADRVPRGIDVLHREILWRFAVGLAQGYESASLRRRLRQEREYMQRFLDRLDARLGELSDGAIELDPGESNPPGQAKAAWDSIGDGNSPFAGILTRREVEVLALLAEGLTNRRIADRLVIAEGTVKFHVNSILKKLRVANRAEAVSRYLTRTRASVDRAS